jgi:hypothetical protein
MSLAENLQLRETLFSISMENSFLQNSLLGDLSELPSEIDQKRKILVYSNFKIDFLNDEVKEIQDKMVKLSLSRITNSVNAARGGVLENEQRT